MHTAPACSTDIPLQRGWPRAIAILVATAAAVGLAWWLIPEQDIAPPLRLGLAAAALISVGLAVRVAGSAGGRRLRWDGADWWFGRPGEIPDHMEIGRLRVMLDLSAFMLLSFKPLQAQARPRVQWIAVQRRGLDAHWHALRCAVYSAPPQASPLTPGDLPRSASPRPPSFE